MTKLRALLVAAMVTGLVFALPAATGAQPGPNGHNDFGLCTAYFAGSDNGKERKRSAPPFAALEEAAANNGQSVEEWCADNGEHPSSNSETARKSRG